MSATLYVLRKSFLNALKQAVKKPAAMVGYVVVIALVALMFIFGGKAEAGAPKNLGTYNALALGIYFLIFALSAGQGLKQGATLFRMADVNFLFTSPVKPQSMLVYAITRQAGILVLASVGMLMQYSNLRINFGLGGGATGGLMLGYILIGLASQLLSANLYALCASKPEARRVATNVLRALGILLGIGFVAFVYQQKGNFASALTGFFGASWWSYVPALGWSQAIAVYSAAGDWGMALLFAFLTLLSCGALGVWLYKSSSDFYEDVLLSAENMETVKQAAKEGRIVSTGAVSKRARREYGPLKGKGAWAFFYRAWREQQKKGLWLLSLTAIGALAGPCFLFILRSAAGDTGGMGLWPALYFSAYMLIFLSLKDGLSMELTHYQLFLAPAPAWKKLVAVSMPQFIKFFVDAAVFFAVSLILVRVDLLEASLGAVTYASLGAVFAACVALIEKLLGASKNKVLIILMYLLTLIVVMLPGFILGGVLGGAGGYLVSAAWNLLASLLIFVLCRNLLHAMET